MAKKVVATLHEGKKDGRSYSKVIKIIGSIVYLIKSILIWFSICSIITDPEIFSTPCIGIQRTTW